MPWRILFDEPDADTVDTNLSHGQLVVFQSILRVTSP